MWNAFHASHDPCTEQGTSSEGLQEATWIEDHKKWWSRVWNNCNSLHRVNDRHKMVHMSCIFNILCNICQLPTHLIAKGNKLPASKLNVRCKLSNLLLRRSSVDSSTPNSSDDLVSYKSFLQELSLLKAQETHLGSDNPFQFNIQ